MVGQVPKHMKFLFPQKKKIKTNPSVGNSEINSINVYLASCCHVNLDHDVTCFPDLYQTS